jgi:hypothetical protein
LCQERTLPRLSPRSSAATLPLSEPSQRSISALTDGDGEVEEAEVVADAPIVRETPQGSPDFSTVSSISMPSMDGNREDEAAPVVCCVPFSLLAPRRKFRHVKLPEEVVQEYITRFGERCFAYVHLHNAQYHYEVGERMLSSRRRI